MRNRRLVRFGQAISETPSGRSRWTDVADDPNDPAALVARARTLQSAWRAEVPDRVDFLLARCRGRRVLDIGCVAHDTARMSSATWLHARLASVASSCLGVDVLEEGVAEMNKRGYSAVAHDLTDGPGPVAARGPFDVVVAGELIEHVADLGMIFRTARDVLEPSGILIVTTPNPYAPHRVRAGQRGICWENVDHIVYAFPSGIAELAERNGLVLAEAATTSPKRRPLRLGRETAKRLRQRLHGTDWTGVGYTTQGPLTPIRLPSGTRRAGPKDGRGLRFIGETFIYVLRPQRVARP